MAELVNRKTKLIEEVPDSDVTARFLSGQYGFRPGEQVPVIAPDGSFGTIAAERAQDAFQKGFAFDTGYRQRREQQEFGDRSIEAFLAGGARGATLGLSDIALTRTGLAEPETLRGIEKHNAGASIAGEIAGTALPLIGSVFEPTPAAETAILTRLGSRVASAIGAPARTVAQAGVKAGQLAEAGTKALNITNPALKYVAEKTLARVAEGAVTGAGFAAGQAVSDLALEDPKLLAEQTMADLGVSVLTRAGEGAVLGGAVSGAIGTAVDAAKAARQLLRPGFQWIKRQIEEKTSEAWWRALSAEQAVKSLGPTKGEAKLIAKKLATHRQTEETMERIGGIERMGRDLRTEGIVAAGDTLDTSAEKLAARVKALGEQIDDEYKILDKFATTRTSTFGKGEAGLKGARRAGEETATFRTDDILDTVRMDPGTPPSDETALSSIFQRFRGREASATRPINEEARKNLLPKAETFRNFVESSVLKPIAKEPTLTAVHRRLSRDLNVRMANLQGREQITFGEIWEWRRYVDDTINWRSESQSLYNAYAREYRNAFKNYMLKEADRVLEYADPQFVTRFQEMNRLYSSLRMAEDIAESTMAGDLRNRSLSLTDHLAAVMTGAVSGSWLLGIGAAALNKFIVRERGNQILSAMADKVADLGVLGSLQQRTAARFNGIVDAISLGQKLPSLPASRTIAALTALTTTAPERVVAEQDPGGTTPVAPRPDEGEPRAVRRDEVEAYERLVQELQALASNPDRIVERMHSFSGEANDLALNAPNAYGAMMEQANQAIQYLLKSAPRSTRPPSPWGPRWEPNDSELHGFSRRVEAVNDPLSVLESLTRGFPTKEGIETLHTLYPALMQSLQGTLMERFAESRARPPYEIRLNLSRLFGQPLDPMLEPHVIQQLQQGLPMPPEERPEGGPQIEQRGGARATGGAAARRKSQNVSEAMGERLKDGTETDIGRLSQ